MEPVADTLFNYLRNVIYAPHHAALDIENLPEGFRDYGKAVIYFSTCMMEITALAKKLSKGDLNGELPSRNNEMGAPLKALHATLKHLTWQSQQVAKGDYQQRVDFMGDFSEAFNSMVEQLDQRRTALLAEIESGRQKTHALSQSHSLLEAITGNISQWIVVVDRVTQEWLYVNHDASEILAGLACESQAREWLKGHIDVAAEKNEITRAELEWSGGGSVQYFSLATYPLSWHERGALAIVFTDISAEKTHLHELENAAYRDTLTGLHNRRYGMELLNEWLAAGQSFIICFLDMDNLKYVNDRYGHAEGDRYILRVVGILRGFSKDAIVCRLGGDEFMLMALGCKISETEILLESIREYLIQGAKQSKLLYNHSISYGVIEVGVGNSLPAGELLRIADEKMYEYKRSHKAQRECGV